MRSKSAGFARKGGRGSTGRVLRLCLAIVFFCVPLVAEADDGRTLGGYRFIPSSLIGDAFVATYFRSGTGIAVASNVDTPILVIGGSPPDTLLSLTGSLLFVLAEFEYQQVVHPRVAVRVMGGGGSRVGTSGQSILSQGVSALVSAGLGTTVALWRNERVLLSGVADLGYGNGLAINLVKFAEDLIVGEIENARLLTTEDVVRIDGGLRAAWAAKTWMGFNGVAQLGYSNADARKEDLLWRVAGAASADFGQRGDTPVGLQLSVDIDKLKQRTANTDGAAVFVGLGVYYTGREDFSIGLEGNWGRLPLFDSDVVIHPVSWLLALRYYF